MKKITVLYFIDVFYKLSGAERNLFEILSRIDRTRFCPIVVCIHDGSMSNEIKRLGIEILNLNLKKMYSIIAFGYLFKIINFIKKRKVDIIVTYHESSDFFGLLVGKLARVPVILSSRRDMGYKLKKSHILLYKFINKLFDRIITVSDAVKNEVCCRQKAYYSQIVTVYNGVDIERFTAKADSISFKEALGLNAACPVVGIIAALRPIKGHIFFIEAAEKIIKRIPNVIFLIVGSGDPGDDYESRLKNEVVNRALKNNILFLGERSDIPEILSVLDISVLSSINEGFPNIVLESMAAGRPVVASAGGGTCEAIKHGETGFLVNPEDSVGLAESIIDLLLDKDKMKRFGIESRRRAIKEFSIEKMIERVESLYSDLLTATLIKRTKCQVKTSLYAIEKFKEIIKSVFCYFLYYAVFVLFRNLVLGNKRITILAYHRVNDLFYDPLGMAVEPVVFEKQLRCLKRFFVPISLGEAVMLLQKKEKIRNNFVVVTFDDGYMDNFLIAYPLLKKYDIPASIFLSVGSINSNKKLWFDSITQAFAISKVTTVDLAGICERKIFLDDDDSRSAVSVEVVRSLKLLPPRERERKIAVLFNKLGLLLCEKEHNNDLLTWESIRAMQKDGITIGSHGISHTILTRLPFSEAKEEIVRSMEIIYSHTGARPIHFAFPNGNMADFNKELSEQITQAGYSSAATLVAGFNEKGARLTALKRFCITSKSGLNLYKRFSKEVFLMEISGVFVFLKCFSRQKRNIYE